MKAVGGRILIKLMRLEGATQKIGALEIPVEANEFDRAKVISVGSEVKDVKDGDEIYIYQGSGKTFHHEGEEYKVISSSEVIVVL